MQTSVVIIGGGQAGLAMSRTLSSQGIDHVVLERHRVGHAWRAERWDSLRLLTPNYLTRLPGAAYTGADPDGFMTAAEVAAFLTDYAGAGNLPVQEGVSVQQVRPNDDGFETITNGGVWRSRCVVDATGACKRPKIPEVAAGLPHRISQLTPLEYRNPAQVPEGNVLVVGASASGAQIADELARAGRAVTLAVGAHVRLPRTYRGVDIHRWMDVIGILDEHHCEIDDIDRARRVPSLQLIGTPERRNIGLNELAANGVRFTGKFMAATGTHAQFSGAFANACRSADLKQQRLLDLVDDWVTAHGLDAGLAPPDRPAPTSVDCSPLTMPLDAIDTVVWATGYRPHHPWLPSSALDARGHVRHQGGVVPIPGLYLIGQPFMRRRKSAFLCGVGDDADAVSRHIVGDLSH